MRKSLKRWLIPMSAAMIALLSAGTAFAEDMVNVKVENTRGGSVKASYRIDNEDGSRTVVNLPIGETVQVPRGTKIRYYAVALDYYPSANVRYDGMVFDVLAHESDGLVEPEETRTGWNSQSGSFTADTDMVISGNFKGISRNFQEYDDDEEENGYSLSFEKDEDNEISGQIVAGKFSDQLYIYNWETHKTEPINNVTCEINSVNYTNDEDEYDPEYEAQLNEAFVIDTTGKIYSTIDLKAGDYELSGNFPYVDGEYGFYLYIKVGSSVEINYPFALYKEKWNSSYYEVQTNDYDELLSRKHVADPKATTFNDVLNSAKDDMPEMVGHELGELTEFNGKTFNNIGSQKVINKIEEKYPVATTYVSFKGYSVPIVEPLTENDLMPEKLSEGWNQIGGEWYYYETSNRNSRVHSDWVPCREEDGEYVWVGADSKVVSNAIVKTDTGRYLVGEKGHKLRNQTDYTFGNVDYTTDGDGMITGSKLHLATPSDAAKAKQFVKDVMDNQENLSPEDLRTAADMTTEALQKNIDTSKLTKEEIKNFADLYRTVYGADSIDISGSDDADAMIVAAGLTSKDFEGNGNVTIDLGNVWTATSSNPVKVDLKLYVNGTERALTAPVTAELDLPDAFIASYSNASYKFKVSPEPVSYEIKDGKLIITFKAAGIYSVQAVRKSSGGSSSSGGSHSYTSHAVSTSVQAGYKASNGKSGNWILDSKGWWFKYQDGTWPKSEWLELEWNGTKNWYYFGADGYMATGWYQDGGKWYYLHPKADGTRGYMYTGWHQIGNNWYYFRVTAGGPKGSLVVNATTPDGYKVNENGEWVK